MFQRENLNPIALTRSEKERMANVDLKMITALHTFTRSFNMIGGPSVTLSCGVGESTTPIVFQLVGAQFSEDRLLNLGHVFQQSTEWHRRRPDLAS